MKWLKKYLIILVFVFSKNLFAQPYSQLNNDYNYFIENSVSDSINFHSEIKPYPIPELVIDSTRLRYINYKFFDRNKNTFISPIFTSEYSNSKNNDFGINLSAGAGIKAQYKHWYIQINLTGNLSKFPSFIDEKIDSNKIIPHVGRFISKNNGYYTYSGATGLLVYTPKDFISLALGYDKNFIGDGYRSLFLSDNPAPYPFAKITIQAWHIKYFALLASFSDVNTSVTGTGLYQKYGIFHYFSLNVSNRLNFGFYENIIWKAKDSADYRGIEWAYLNPVIFLRPVEASINSPDNEGLGGSGRLRLWRKTFLYGQLFLDDIWTKQFFVNNGWWGNKYGLQAGIKAFNTFGITNFYTQLEYNFARPYTYSHETSMTNMGNMYQALAHPLGANFYELVEICRYGKDRWWVKLKSSEAIYGDDTLGYDYGKNIYKSYILRNARKNKDYDNRTLQGVKTYLTNIEISYNYILVPKWNCNLQVGYRLYNQENNQVSKHDNYIFFGISTLLYNNETDY